MQTGNQFDPSVPAYLSAAGGNAGAVTDQPLDEAYGMHSLELLVQMQLEELHSMIEMDLTTGMLIGKMIKFVADC